MPAGKTSVFPALLVVVPKQTGPQIPVAAIQTDPSGGSYAVTAHDTHVPITIRGTANGQAIVSGVSAGTSIQLCEASESSITGDRSGATPPIRRADPVRRAAGPDLGGPGSTGRAVPGLVKQPSVVLADEPTGNLDAESAAVVWRALHEEAARGATVIVRTHHLDQVAAIVLLVLSQTTVPAIVGVISGTAVGIWIVRHLTGSLPPPGFTVGLAVLALLCAMAAAVPPALTSAFRDPVRILRVP